VTLEEFYAQEPRRKASGEVDFGVMWGDWPHRRVSWIKATGEVYAVRQNRELDGVEVLGVVGTREELEARLHGWPEHIHIDAGLGWIRERLEGASTPAAEAALDRMAGEFSGEVVDSGGGRVLILVDRDTLFYPAVGRRVRVIFERTGKDREESLPFEVRSFRDGG
jgi:hypothetical protein